MLVLHQFEISPFCDKVRRVLHAKGLAYEIREVPPTRTAIQLRKLNRVGKLPCLEHDGNVVCDSTDIAHYLEERFPDPPLLPADARDRAQCHVLEDWADESLYFYEATMRFTWPENASRWVPELLLSEPAWVRPVAAAVVPLSVRRMVRAQGVGRKSHEALLIDVERHVNAVEGLLASGKWLVGASLTLADISVFAQFHCIGGTPEGAGILRDKPRVQAWMTRVNDATARR